VIRDEISCAVVGIANYCAGHCAGKTRRLLSTESIKSSFFESVAGEIARDPVLEHHLPGD
jgi:hypothetical protein